MRKPAKEIPQLTDKFLKKFKSFICVNDENGCHEWMGAICLGYGIVRVALKPGSRSFRAHRISYFIHNGSISTSMVIDHICRNKRCVNPNHLREVTCQINSIENSDGVVFNNHKKYYCKRGHPFDLNNTRVVKKGRACRECERIRKKEYRARKKYANKS